jgi:hypothetical protein
MPKERHASLKGDSLVHAVLAHRVSQIYGGEE